MAEHQHAQATTSRSPNNKSSWLAALDELEQELLTSFQKGGGDAGDTARADVEAPRSAPKLLGWRPRIGS
jgi:hypothetical protein